jgi:hypothetical protein
MSLVGFKITNHPQQVGKRGASDTVDERITPASVFEPLRDEFAFTLDAAANATNRKVPQFYDLANDGLVQSWGSNRVWCNPPYSNIRPWVEKAWAEHRGGCPLIASLIVTDEGRSRRGSIAVASTSDSRTTRRASSTAHLRSAACSSFGGMRNGWTAKLGR